MPSAKNQKSSHAQHPPSNRAFALRMMNSSQNVEGRTSPLDRALKPFKDTFKKANKNKKSKEKVLQSPTAGSHSDLESKDDDTSDVSYESLSNSHRSELPWTAQSKKVMVENSGNGKMGEYNYGKHGHRQMDFGDYNYNHRSYGRHMGMQDISEEDELQYYGQDEGPHRHREKTPYREHSYFLNGDSFDTNSVANGHMSKSGRNESWVEENIRGDAQGSFDDDKSYFIAPNGEVVKLRKKKTDEQQGSEQRNSITMRTEKFGKRLSMLCHMLAEKYPEDFHILELLVELQVSNEKREEEMNNSVSLLKKKMKSMEERLTLIEQQSLSGFQQMLIPLAAAAEAFSSGMKKSLSHLEQGESAKKNTHEENVATGNDQEENDTSIENTSSMEVPSNEFETSTDLERTVEVSSKADISHDDTVSTCDVKLEEGTIDMKTETKLDSDQMNKDIEANRLNLVEDLNINNEVPKTSTDEDLNIDNEDPNIDNEDHQFTSETIQNQVNDISEDTDVSKSTTDEIAVDTVVANEKEKEGEGEIRTNDGKAAEQDASGIGHEEENGNERKRFSTSETSV